MKPLRVFLVSWALAGLGALVGSILGNSMGKAGLFAGAVVGGVAGVAVAIAALVRLAWLAQADRRGALVGGTIGFLIAAAIAVANLHTPITPVLVCGLSGAGALLGTGVARGWRR
jgi:hypothetical protein